VGNENGVGRPGRDDGTTIPEAVEFGDEAGSAVSRPTASHQGEGLVTRRRVGRE
jgi:hypothetical protein